MCIQAKVFAAVIALAGSSAVARADAFYLVDNTAKTFLVGSTGSPSMTTVLNQLGNTSWTDLSAGDTPDIVFASDLTNPAIASISTIDGSIVSWLFIDRPARSIAYDWQSGVLYALPQTGPVELFTIDLVTGVTTVVGSPNIPGGPIDLFGLGYDPVTGKLFITTWQSTFYSVDPATAVSTLVGNTGEALLFDVAFNPADGELYVTNSGNDSLYRVDRATAQLTLVGGPYAHSMHGTGLAFAINSFATAYCFGDGSGAFCPCANFGTTGQGCANGTGRGATLAAGGTNSISAADLVLRGAKLPPGQPGLFFQGEIALNGGLGIAFGDGLRCAGVGIVRLQVVFADASGGSSTTVDIATLGGVSAGQTRNYQLWYRDAFTSPCGTTINLSHGLELTWEP